VNHGKIRDAVRRGYGEMITTGCGCALSCNTGACGPAGYSKEDLAVLPESAIQGLGCGNPTALAGIAPGDTVLDLGAGPGGDCLIAARKAGPQGKVIGIDMTPEMIEQAERNAELAGISNVEFRLAEIEKLPVDDDSVDVVISNCVVNLAPDKAAVFAEAYRVLKPGGRLVISDIVLAGELPAAVQNSVRALVSCISGALPRKDYLSALRKAGFRDVKVLGERSYRPQPGTEGPAARPLADSLGVSPEDALRTLELLIGMDVSATKAGIRDEKA